MVAVDQTSEPANVYKINFGNFIPSNPAGTEIISLITGIIRPKNTALSPYFSNQISTLSSFFSEIFKNLRYLMIINLDV